MENFVGDGVTDAGYGTDGTTVQEAMGHLGIDPD